MDNKGFDLSAILGDVSKLDTVNNIQNIELCKIDQNEKNFFQVEEDITDLAESIAINGLLQPLVVRPLDTGRYRLIAGHRRFKALSVLAAEHGGKWQSVPCMVVNPANDELEELMLIQTNTSARELGWSEKSTAATRIEIILVKLQQERGVTLPGKMRANVAKILKTSESQLARAKFINEHLITDFQSKKSPYHLTDDMSYKLAHLESTWQQELFDHYAKSTWRLDGSALSTFKANKAAGLPSFAEKPKEPSKCYSYPTKKGGYLNCTNENARNTCKKNNSVCCNSCKYRYECKTICENIKKSFIEHQKTDMYTRGRILKATREEAGFSREDLKSGLKSTYADAIVSFENGLTNPSLPDLLFLCETLNVSADRLLGRNVSAENAFSIWNTGIPKDAGYYFVLTDRNGGGGKLLYFNNGQWLHPAAMIELTPDVTYWAKAPTMPVGFVFKS